MNTPRFYAITGLGWGRGDTAQEAIDNYLRVVRKNFPHLSDEERDEVWGFVWEAPEGTTGFFIDNRVHWLDAEERPTVCEPTERRQAIGTLPDWVEFTPEVQS